MSSSAAGTVRRIVSTPSAAQPGDLLLTVDEITPPEGVQVFVAREPGDIGMLVSALFGNHVTGLELASTPCFLSGLPADRRQEYIDAVDAVVQQWGNSVLDGAHGLSNLMRNAERLLPAPRVRMAITTAPVLAIGAGPSTAAMLEDIRIASRSCLVVACDAALKPLLAAGIRVDACTPLERLRSTAWKLPDAIPASVVYAGSPFAPPAAVEAFARHTLWPTCDPVFDWYECPDEPGFNPGPTTGTNAIAVALRLTSGPVLLVGHDLCGGHMAGAEQSAKLADDFDAERMGYDGTLRPTKTAWLRAKYDIEGMNAENRLVNVAGHRGFGLRLDGVAAGPMPPVGRMRPVRPLADMLSLCQADTDRLDRFHHKARHLAADLGDAARAAQSARCLEEVCVQRLAPARSQDALGYLLRSLYAQCSLERRLGRPQEHVLATFREAIRNIHDAFKDALTHG